MQFQNPEILYFLALLIIPIIVHLFQLQKFVKVPFTNVAFLQKIEQQTRKSSRIKKWLILATRLTLFSAIVFAFSQPYLSNKKLNIKQHIFIYLDNSLSTNTKGEKGNLLPVAIQEIIENAPQNDNYSLLTNSNYYPKISYSELKKQLLKTKNTSKKTDFKNILLKIENSKSTKIKTLHKSILISDFQNIKYKEFTNVTGDFSSIQLKNTQKNNLSIDSVFVSNTNTTNTSIQVVVKNQGATKNNIPIAIFNADKLVSKQTFSAQENSTKTIVFNIQNQPKFLGKINISFSDTFIFDNTFYFTLNTTKKVNVLNIGNSSNFLSKIYTKDEFNYTSFSKQYVNYNVIPKQQIIILNELEKIPETLSKSLINFSNKGGTIVLIPNLKSDINSYNSFLNEIGGSTITSKISDSLKITNINFNHPLFKNVFAKKVSNFQYPIIKSYYPILSKKNSNIITLENNKPFISQIKTSKNNIYWVSSALSKANSNFINSPLIVPVFYNFAKLSFKHTKLYYYLDNENKIDIETSLKKDDILTIINSKTSFIPPQQTYQNKVSITTKNNPQEDGFYYIINKKDTLKTIAFNTPKKESLLQFLDTKNITAKKSNINFHSYIPDFFEKLNKKNEVHWLWKWFLTLAIVSLLLEILILKFYKT